jgi:hypothetical protein
MSDSEQEQQGDQAEAKGEKEQSTDEFVRDMEDDPSTAGPPENPADDLRGG